VTGSFPALRATVLDTTDARELGEFYRQLLGYRYRPRDVPAPDGSDETPPDWLVLLDDAGVARLAIQRVDAQPHPTWPDPAVPQQLHLDMTVGDVEELAHQRARALALGATELEDRSGDPAEPLHVLADPAGHPFCIFVSPDHPG
jgi:hypothetical protein